MGGACTHPDQSRGLAHGRNLRAISGVGVSTPILPFFLLGGVVLHERLVGSTMARRVKPVSKGYQSLQRSSQCIMLARWMKQLSLCPRLQEAQLRVFPHCAGLFPLARVPGEMLLDSCACTTDSCAVWFLGFDCQRCTRHRVHIRCGRSALIPFPFLPYQERCEVSKLGNETPSAAARVEKPYQCFREREVL
jgi:hypothetical protein